MDGQNLEIEQEQQNIQLRNEYEELLTHEMRKDVRLAANEHQQLDDEKRSYHTVDRARAENIRIQDMLSHAEGMHLKESEKTSLRFRIRQNKNFEMINSEKFGGDSKKMKAVKDSIREVDAIFSMKVGKAFNRQELINNAISAVEKAITNCDAYLARGKSWFFWRKNRYDLVAETKARFEEDLQKLIQAAESYQNEDSLVESEDTLLGILNTAEISSRQEHADGSENEIIRSAVKRDLYGVGSYDYEYSTFKKNLTTQGRLREGRDFSPDRTSSLVAFCMFESKGILDGAKSADQFRIYENLSVKVYDDVAGAYTQEQKQAKIDTIEGFFEILMAYDVKNFDFKNTRELFTSDRFKKNYTIMKAGWDADVLFREYRSLLNDNKGLKLRYSADDFAEIEAKRNMMGTISAYYDALEIYYTNKELWEENMDRLMNLSMDEVTERMNMAAANGKMQIVNFYSSILNIKGGREYSVNMPAESLLQDMRKETVNKYILLSEEFKNDSEFTDVQKNQLKERLINEIKGDRAFDEIDPNVLPYEYLKSVVVMLSDKRPSEAEYVKTVTDYMKDLMDNEDMQALSEQIGSMDVKTEGSELRDLCVYALSYGSKAPELSKESFEDLDTVTLKDIIINRQKVEGFVIDENTTEEKKKEMASVCRSILVELFKADQHDVSLLSPERALSCVKKALKKVPDMGAIGDIIGGRFDILLDSFTGMKDMDEAALLQLKEKSVAEIKKDHEFKDLIFEALPLDAVKDIVKKLSENNPSPEAFEGEVKKYINEFYTRMPIDACMEKARTLDAKEEKTDKDRLDISEYNLSYLLNNNPSAEVFEALKRLDAETLKSVASDKAAAMKLADGGFDDIGKYNDARKLCIRCLTSYMGQKAGDIELLPVNVLVTLTRHGFEKYPDISEVPREIAAAKEALIRDVLETEREEAEESEFARSLYAAPEKGEMKEAEARERYITRIIAHTKEYGSKAATKHLSNEMLRQIAIGTNLFSYLPADKLDRTMYKETFDEYSADIASALAGAFGLEEGQKNSITSLGFDELFKMAGEMKDWLLDAGKYEEAKAYLVKKIQSSQVKEGEKIILKEAPMFVEPMNIIGSHKAEFRQDWTKEEGETLSLIGELAFSTNVTDENGLAYKAEDRVREVLLANASVIAKLMSDDKDPGIMTKLLNGMKKSEQALVGGVGEVVNGILEKMKELKDNKKWDAAAVKECLKDESMKEFLSDKDKDIEKAVLEGSAAIQSNMDLVTESALESAEDTIGNLYEDPVQEQKKTSDRDKLDEMRDSMYKKDTANGKFLQKLLKDYYRYSTPEEQRFMMSYVIKDLKPVQTSREYDMSRFSKYYTSLVKGAGPVMQKLIQGIPERVVSEGLGAAVRASKSSLRPISEKYVDQVLDRMKQSSGGNIKSIKKLRSLGAASIAETFLCEIKDKKGTTKQVVVKVKRPDAKMHIENESKFLVKLANDADTTGVMGNAVANHINKITEELDFTNEVKNALVGQSVYKGTDSKTHGTVKSVEINKSIPIGEDYIVMDKAEGVTLDRYILDLKKRYESIMAPLYVTDVSGKTKRALTKDNIAILNEVKEQLYKEMMSAQHHKEHVYRLAHKWCYEAFFNKYFHHGDLHSGNIMISENNATVLDYGNASKFTGKEIDPITRMTAAAGTNNTEYYVEAMVDLLAQENIKVSDEQKEQLKKKFCPIMALGKEKDAGKRILVTILIAQESGIPVPRAIHNFALCEQRLENSIDEMNNIIEEMQNTFTVLNGTGLHDSLNQVENNPLLKYITKYRKNYRLKKNQKSESDLCDEMEEEYGLLDAEYFQKKLTADNKDNDYAEGLLEVHVSAAGVYESNKANIETVRKNRDKWLKQIADLKKLVDNPNADQNLIQAKRKELSSSVEVLFKRGMTDLLTAYGHDNIAMMYQTAFVDLDLSAAEKYLDVYTKQLDLSLKMVKTGEKYLDNKDRWLVTSGTKAANRKAFAESCLQYNNYKTMADSPSQKQIDSLDPDSQDGLIPYRMHNRLSMLHDDIAATDKKGKLKYGDPAQWIMGEYDKMKEMSNVEIHKRFMTDKKLQGTVRYFSYIFDETRQETVMIFNSMSQINTAEGKAFKNAYDDYKKVCDKYIRAKFFGDGTLNELGPILKAAKEKLHKAYNSLIKSEIEKHRKFANVDKGSEFDDLADILSDEIISNKEWLVTRVGLDFSVHLKPDTPEYQAKYGVKAKGE